MQHRYERRNAAATPASAGRVGIAASTGTQFCDVSKTTTVQRGTAAGTVNTLTQQLDTCDYFLPLCVRFWFVDAAAPTTLRVAEIQQVKIGACEQECGSQAPGVLNTALVGLTLDYSVVDEWCGVPVCWGVFTQENLNWNCGVGYSNIDTGTGDFYSTMFGNPCVSPPPGCTPGTPFARGL